MNPVDVCNEFALKHKVIFEEDGEVGMGRPCVGFVRGDGYVDYNPYLHEWGKMEFNGKHGWGNVYLLVALLFWMLFLAWALAK
jgi:hypothetical protein